MSRTALIAGQGQLPAALANALDRAGEAWVARHLDGFAPQGVERSKSFQIEQLGTLLAELPSEGVTRVVFGGALARPAIDPTRLDAATMPLVPRMARALMAGDDAALRVVIALFEEAGMTVVGAAEVAPELVEVPEIGAPSEADLRDIDRARAVHAALGDLDVGQGVVAAAGQILAVEALPGTDWMLASLVPPPEGTPDFARPAGGVFVKAPKPGQDRRIDLPTIGPDTVRRVADAGLNGIAVEAGGVIVLDPGQVADLARETGVWLHGFAP